MLFAQAVAKKFHRKSDTHSHTDIRDNLRNHILAYVAGRIFYRGSKSMVALSCFGRERKSLLVPMAVRGPLALKLSYCLHNQGKKYPAGYAGYHIPTFGIIWKFQVNLAVCYFYSNLAYVQVNPLWLSVFNRPFSQVGHLGIETRLITQKTQDGGVSLLRSAMCQ